jgi:hypothetical protein
MTRLPVRHAGFVFAGQDTPRAEVLAAVREELITAGRNHLEVDELLVDRKGLVVAAWWGGDELGFVGEDHPNAQPVTVVNVS